MLATDDMLFWQYNFGTSEYMRKSNVLSNRSLVQKCYIGANNSASLIHRFLLREFVHQFHSKTNPEKRILHKKREPTI